MKVEGRGICIGPYLSMDASNSNKIGIVGGLKLSAFRQYQSCPDSMRLSKATNQNGFRDSQLSFVTGIRCAIVCRVSYLLLCLRCRTTSRAWAPAAGHGQPRPHAAAGRRHTADEYGRGDEQRGRHGHGHAPHGRLGDRGATLFRPYRVNSRSPKF